MPCLRAFWEEICLPEGVRGPVESWALRRLAAIWAGEAIGGESFPGDMEQDGTGGDEIQGTNVPEGNRRRGYEAGSRALCYPLLFQPGWRRSTCCGRKRRRHAG